MADPVEMARYYNASGADELVFYDITASVEGRGLFTDILRQVASQIFIPLTVGGGINTLDDFDRVLKCGADKVSVNSRHPQPRHHPAAAQKYGNQCVCSPPISNVWTANLCCFSGRRARTPASMRLAGSSRASKTAQESWSSTPSTPTASRMALI